MSYLNRRYRYRDGRLEKAWDSNDKDGWCKTKEEALEAATAPDPVVEEAAPVPVVEEAETPKPEPRAKRKYTRRSGPRRVPARSEEDTV